MSFVIYLCVLIFTAGAALFGLDLLTAPLPQHPSMHASSSTSASKLARREADARQMREEGTPGTLTPIYPAHPGEKSARGADNTPAETASSGTAARADAAVASSTRASSERQQAAAANENELRPSDVPQSAAQPVAQAAAPHCDVAACASAYRSFRAADCTYQPFTGPRRVCTAAPDTQRSADRMPLRQLASPRQLAQNREPVREVRIMRPPLYARDDMRGDMRNDVDDDADDDGDVGSPIGVLGALFGVR